MSHSTHSFGKSWRPKIIGIVVKQYHAEARKMAVIIAESLVNEGYCVAFT